MLETLARIPAVYHKKPRIYQQQHRIIIICFDHRDDWPPQRAHRATGKFSCDGRSRANPSSLCQLCRAHGPTDNGQQAHGPTDNGPTDQRTNGHTGQRANGLTGKRIQISLSRRLAGELVAAVRKSRMALARAFNRPASIRGSESVPLRSRASMTAPMDKVWMSRAG